MDKEKREKIIATLNKLRAMAEKGCNEQEVETAARLLRKQLDKYGLTMADLKEAEASGSSTERKGFKTVRKDSGMMANVMGAIASFCDCRCWFWEKDRWEFMGFPNDVVAAEVMARLIESASIHEWNLYKQTLEKGEAKPYVRWDFVQGFMIRISQRLNAMTRERREAQAVNALVLRKKDIIEHEMHEMGIHLGENRSRGREPQTREHVEAGYRAGGKVALDSRGAVE